MKLSRVYFPPADYQRLFSPNEQTLRQLDPAEDGAHWLSDDEFFEWWYFDAHFDNGYQLVVVLHTALFNVTSRPAVIAIHLYGPDGWKAVEVAAFRPWEVRGIMGRCDVRMGSSRVWDAGDRYIVHLEQGRIRARLEYHREVAGSKIGTGILFADQVSGRSFHWVIPLPRASISGWLWVDGKRVAVKGTGYHDHNWGNLDIGEVFQRWVWGRVVADEYTLVFGELLGRGAADLRVIPFALWQGPNPLLGTGRVKIRFTESQIEGRADSRYPDYIELRADGGPLFVQTVLRTRRVLDVIDFAYPRFSGRKIRRAAEKMYFLAERLPLLGQQVKQWVGHGTYLRLQAGCELNVTDQGRTDCRRGNALCEIMNFRAVF